MPRQPHRLSPSPLCSRARERGILGSGGAGRTSHGGLHGSAFHRIAVAGLRPGVHSGQALLGDRKPRPPSGSTCSPRTARASSSSTCRRRIRPWSCRAPRWSRATSSRRTASCSSRPDELKALDEASQPPDRHRGLHSRKAVDPIYYDKAYFLAPDKRGGKPYSLLLRGHAQERPLRAGALGLEGEAVRGAGARGRRRAGAAAAALRRRGALARGPRHRASSRSVEPRAAAGAATDRPDLAGQPTTRPSSRTRRRSASWQRSTRRSPASRWWRSSRSNPPAAAQVHRPHRDAACQPGQRQGSGRGKPAKAARRLAAAVTPQGVEATPQGRASGRPNATAATPADAATVRA